MFKDHDPTSNKGMPEFYRWGEWIGFDEDDRQAIEVFFAEYEGWLFGERFFYVKPEESDEEEWFFQSFGLDPSIRENYVPPKTRKESWTSEDYDERWKWTVILIPNCIGHGQSKPLDWKTIKEMNAERKAREEALLQSLVTEGV